jgi:hypothetical protein
MQGAFGYQGGSYGSGGQTGDTSELGTYFANLSIHNNLNPKFSHSLSIGHQAEQGVASNFTESNYVHYQAGWDVIRKVGLSFFASFEDAKESGGLFAEHFSLLYDWLECEFSTHAEGVRESQLPVYEARNLDRRKPTDGFDADTNLAFNENRVSLHWDMHSSLSYPLKGNNSVHTVSIRFKRF